MNKNQIQFISQDDMIDFIYSNNFYVLVGNNIIYVKNKNNKNKFRRNIKKIEILKIIKIPVIILIKII